MSLVPPQEVLGVEAAHVESVFAREACAAPELPRRSRVTSRANRFALLGMVCLAALIAVMGFAFRRL